MVILKNRSILISLFLICVGVTTYFLIEFTAHNEQASVRLDDVAAVASGKVEPRGGVVNISSSIIGKIVDLKVDEGDLVKEGQVLAILDNEDFSAQVKQAQSQVVEKQENFRKLQNGFRTEEVMAAEAELKREQASLHKAQLDLLRSQKLYARDFASLDDVEQDELLVRETLESINKLKAELLLLRNGTREEDLAIAKAELESAKQAYNEAKGTYHRTILVSPIDGMVLKRHKNLGELMTTFEDLPAFSLGDVSELYVRAEVHEDDIDKVFIDQKARIQSLEFDADVVFGRVTQIGKMMGNKKIRSYAADEFRDQGFVEVLIRIENTDGFIIGQRVDVFFVEEKQKRHENK